MTKEQYIASKLRSIGVELTPGEVKETTDDFVNKLKKRLKKEGLPFPENNDELMDLVASTKTPEEWAKLAVKGDIDAVELAVQLLKGGSPKRKNITQEFLEKFLPAMSLEEAVDKIELLRPLIMNRLKELGFYCSGDKEVFAEMIVSIICAGDIIGKAAREHL